LGHVPLAERDTLRTRVLRGFAWKIASQVITQIAWAASLVVLARLLSPRDYGLAGMVLLFSYILPLLSDLALGNALIQRRELSEADRSTVFWTSLTAGTALTAVGVALAGPLADFYGEPEVKPLFAVLSLGFVITSLGSAHNALMIRELNFRGLELRMITATVSGAVAGISLGLAGYGAWALIGQQLAFSAVSTVLLWTFSPWRPRLTFSLASLRSFTVFSGNIFGANILFQLNRNSDSLLIGRFLGAAPLGVYTLASNVILLPFNKIATPIQEVLFPAFSRMQDERERVAELWLRVNRLVAAMATPSLLALIVIAPDFVAVVLGDRWQRATPVIQILAWAGLLQSLQRLNASILQARDRTGTLVRFSLLQFAAGVVAVIAGMPWGIVGVAAAYAIANTVLQPLYAWLTARAVEVALMRIVRSLSGVAEASLAMLACLLGARALLVAWEIPPVLRLASLTLLGAISFLLFAAWRAPEVVDEVRRVRQRMAGRRTLATGGTQAQATVAAGAGDTRQPA
jgi:O-antigen/teichoic acid export membrane protein